MSDENDDDVSPDTSTDGTLGIQEIDRIFSLLEAAFQMDAIDARQQNQLLELLERLVANPVDDPGLVGEFVSLLEALLLDPEQLEDANVDGILALFEQALAGAASGEERTEDVLSVVEAAVRDPTSVEPEDVERFRSGIEGAIFDLTDPYGGRFGQLFGFSASPSADAETLEAAEDTDLLRLARLAAGMTQRATGYSMESGVRTGTRMAYAAMNAHSPAELLTQTRAITLDELQRSGVDIGDEYTEWLEHHEEELVDGRPLTREALRERGERLLSKSAEVGRDEAYHPSYPSILDQLAADEARILRLLATDGRQAALDVYDRQYIPFTSRLVARNLSKIGSDSGCRHPDRTPIYLQNLDRLGLIRFSDDPVDDLKRYQVLDAQPHIEAAMEKAKRPKTVYRSIQLTELGIDFCEMCLPVTVDHRKQRRRFRGEPADPDTADR